MSDSGGPPSISAADLEALGRDQLIAVILGASLSRSGSAMCAGDSAAGAQQLLVKTESQVSSSPQAPASASTTGASAGAGHSASAVPVRSALQVLRRKLD